MKSAKGKNSQTQRVVELKVQPVKSMQVKEERKKASLHTQRYAEYMVCPYDAESVVPAPSPVPVRETTIRQNLVVDLADYNNAGAFYIEVRPHLADTLSVTTTTADVQDQKGWTVDGAFHNVISNGIDPDEGEMTHLSSGYQQGLMAQSDAAGFEKVCFVVNGSANTSVWNFTASLKANESCECNFRVQAFAASGNWADLINSTVNIVAGHPCPLTGTITVPANCLGITFQARQSSYTYGISIGFGFSAAYSSGTGLLGLGKETLTQKTFGLPLLGSIKDLNSWRITAQDLLVTFEGDTLNDGGAIASARVPRGWHGGTNHPTGNPYADILELPYDRYDGPLKKGTHVHWIPGDIDDLKPINSINDEADFGYFKMVSAGQMTHNTSSVRVRVCTTIAYFSTDPSYGSMDWAPPPTDLGLMLQYVARVVPAATENDTHLLKKMSKFVGKNINTGFKYLIENPELLVKLASLAASLA